MNELKENDSLEFNEIVKKYEPLIIKEVSKAMGKLNGSAEWEELRQEALMALYKAKESYLEGNGTTFGLYAKICVQNRLLSYIRKVNAAKRREIKRNEQKEVKKSSIGKIFTMKSSEELMNLMNDSLTKKEKIVLQLYLEEKSYLEIAEELNMEVKSVDNALCRAKKKLKTLLTQNS